MQLIYFFFEFKMPKRRTRKLMSGYAGRGWSDWASSIKGYLNTAYDWARKYKPAHNIRKFTGNATDNIPYLGKALQVADYGGFGKRKRKH